MEGYEAKIETDELIDGRRRFKGSLRASRDEVSDQRSKKAPYRSEVRMAVDAKLVLTDELIREMLRQRKDAGQIDEDQFDEIETEEV